ncbi:MAG: hypothetical protein NZ958_07255 [Bacteroidia bacterium]|nr:hypothetical protein [Bacteroidia bacterium]MDW8088719.1 hypothetical protein [Bacteroidia bacterium]
MRTLGTIRHVGVAAIAAAALFLACKREKEQEGPKIEIPAGQGYLTVDTTVEQGSHQIKFGFRFSKGTKKDDADLESYSFLSNQGAADQPIFSNRPARDKASFLWDTTMNINGVAGAVYTYTAVVRDKNGKEARRSLKITFRQPTTNTPSLPITGSVTLIHTGNNPTNFLVLSNRQFSAKALNELNSVNAADVIAAFFVRSAAPKTYSLITPDSLGKGVYTDPAINWTAASKPTTIFYDINQQEYNGVADSASLRQLVQGLPETRKVKYIENGDGTRATIYLESGTLPQGISGPHEYLAFKQSLGSSNIWGIIRRTNAGNSQATLEVKAIRF